MRTNKHIVFTGGGTAGHVTPNIALIHDLKKENWEMSYVGSYEGVEKRMIEALALPYYAVHSGKLRRYLSVKNFIEPYKIFLGLWQAYILLGRLQAKMVFSKGGFVAFPVVIAAWLRGIPVIAHESDFTPGLANRLSFPFVKKICLAFEATKARFKKTDKIIFTGTPIRQELFQGKKERGLALCHFNLNKPILLVMGGSLGSQLLNQVIRENLAELSAQYQIIHLCGRGKIDSGLLHHPNYFQLEYAQDELADLFAASDVIISRAGANSLYEILALEKPHLLIPLSKKVSRGDQIDNALFFKNLGISEVIAEEELSKKRLITAIQQIYEGRENIKLAIRKLGLQSATGRIIEIIKKELMDG